MEIELLAKSERSVLAEAAFGAPAPAPERDLLSLGGPLGSVPSITFPATGVSSAQPVSVLSTIAHELRGPLHALATSSELLAEDAETLDIGQIQGMATRIHHSAVWLHELVENLLCAAMIGDGRFYICAQPTNLMQVISEAKPIVETLLDRSAQQLRVSTHGVVPLVLADGRRIGQVLVNLVLNAAKFSGHGSTIDLSISGRPGAVRITVADRGPGLPNVDRSRLFDPFYRATHVTRQGTDGVGLGLAIVRSVIEAHGSHVSAGNRRGGGARFWFDLPVSPGGPMPGSSSLP